MSDSASETVVAAAALTCRTEPPDQREDLRILHARACSRDDLPSGVGVCRETISARRGTEDGLCNGTSAHSTAKADRANRI